MQRFTDMGDGTVRDNNTNLIWLKNANTFGRMIWDDAMIVAANLSSGENGLTDGSVNGDWRLPTKKEWKAFVDINYTDPALSNAAGDGHWTEGDAFCYTTRHRVHTPTGVQSDFYWSSTEWATYWSYGVYMSNGSVHYDGKGNGGYVWPVRSGN